MDQNDGIDVLSFVYTRVDARAVLGENLH
jgi:hypothetical protein